MCQNQNRFQQIQFVLFPLIVNFCAAFFSLFFLLHLNHLWENEGLSAYKVGPGLFLHDVVKQEKCSQTSHQLQGPTARNPKEEHCYPQQKYYSNPQLQLQLADISLGDGLLVVRLVRLSVFLGQESNLSALLATLMSSGIIYCSMKVSNQ